MLERRHGEQTIFPKSEIGAAVNSSNYLKGVWQFSKVFVVVVVFTSKGNRDKLRLRKEDTGLRKTEAIYTECIGVAWSQIPRALPVGQEAAYARTGWLGRFTGDVRLAAAPAVTSPSAGTWQEEELHTQPTLLRASSRAEMCDLASWQPPLAWGGWGAGSRDGCWLGSKSSGSSRRVTALPGKGRGGEGFLLDTLKAHRPVPREGGCSVVISPPQGSLEPPAQHLNTWPGNPDSQGSPRNSH